METNVAKKRNCIKEKEYDCLSGQTKRIYIPLEKEEYLQVIDSHEEFRKMLDELIERHPEIFPKAIPEGYNFHSFRESKKLSSLRFRRIELKADKAVYMIVPFFVLPYMTGYVEEVEKALFLRHFGVPYWALAYVFGKDQMYWYRIETHIGRNSIVGTTIRKEDDLPDI